MTDTTRTIADLLTNLFQDGQPANSITPQDMRDLIISLSPSETTLSYTSTMTWNVNTDPIAKVTVTGNTTINVSGGETGRAYRLAVIQGGSGNNAVSLGGVTVLNAPAWHTAIGAVNLIDIDMVATTLYASVI